MTIVGCKAKQRHAHVEALRMRRNWKYLAAIKKLFGKSKYEWRDCRWIAAEIFRIMPEPKEGKDA